MSDDTPVQPPPPQRSVCGAWLALLAVVLSAVMAPAPAGADDRTSRLQTTIDQLTAEAEELDQLAQPTHRPTFNRPHATMHAWGPEMGEVTLARLGQSFTGNLQRDTYIRWHLMAAVKSMLRDAFDTFRETGEHRLPADTSRRLTELAQNLPPPLRVPLRPDRWIPEDLAAEYFRLREQSRVVVGIPPFATSYFGDAAVEHQPASQQAAARQLAERINKLRAQIRRSITPEEQAYNNRVSRLNGVIRDYRGDVVYALMQSGDDALIRMVVDEIGRQVNAQQFIGIDLLEHMNYAMLDGYLLLYDAETLNRAGRNLERVVRGADEFRIYRFGDDDPPANMVRRRRNAGDAAFHVVQVLQNTGMIETFGGEPGQRPAVRSDRPPGHRYTGDTLTQRDVRAAIDRALAALNDLDNDNLLPAYLLDDDRRMARRHSRRRDLHELVHQIGNHAVVAWAMLAAGESYQEPGLFRRINWVLSGDPPFTYDRGMRLQMLSHMPANTFGPWVHRDRVMLERGLSDNGNWGHYSGLGTPDPWGDHANGQYGVLGMWGAHQAGGDVSLERWLLIDRHWRNTQQRTADDEPAGWALGMFNVNTGAISRQMRAMPGYERVTGPMTAAGVVALSLTEQRLHGTRQAPTADGRTSASLTKGLRWLQQHFDIDDDTASDWFYYMWTIQRVGQITGHRHFNGVDWFRDVTAEMLNRQGASGGDNAGLWEDPDGRLGTLMSTSFALLYLSSVDTPVAVAKLRFDGEWNNRPHDIWNFTGFASDWYEFDTGWQILDPDAPLHQLIESPIAYLSAGGAFELSDAEVHRLREYIEAGGLLVINEERGAGTGFTRSLNDLRERLLPGESFVPLDSSAVLRNVNRQIGARVNLRAIGNDVRPLVLLFGHDIGDDLQKNDRAGSDSFSLLSNIYLYTVGMNPRRPRLEQHHIRRTNTQLRQRVSAARIRHEGTFDPEPGALRQLQAILANEHEVDLRVETVSPGELSDQQLAFLTTTDTIAMDDDQLEALRRWVDDGGTLWIDPAGGGNDAARAVQQFVRRLSPERLGSHLSARDRIISGENLPRGHDNRQVNYRRYLLVRAGGSTTPRLHAVDVDGRPAIVFSTVDLTAGLAGLGHWGIYGYDVQSARNLVVNGVLEMLDR